MSNSLESDESTGTFTQATSVQSRSFDMRRSFRSVLWSCGQQLGLLTPLLLCVVGTVADFATLYDLFKKSNESKTSNVPFWILWVACLAFSFTTVALVFFLFLAVHVHESVDMENWFHARGKQVKGLVCLIALHFPACEILVSGAFGAEMFDCPLSVLGVRRMRAIQALAVLLDNVPKLAALICINCLFAELTPSGLASCVLAAVDIVGTLAASGIFWILTSEIERSRLRQRQLGRYRDGKKLYKLMSIPFAIGLLGLGLEVCLVRFLEVPASVTASTTTLVLTTSLPSPPVSPTPAPVHRGCPKKEHGSKGYGASAPINDPLADPNADTAVNYLNYWYKCFNNTACKAPWEAGTLGVYIKLLDSFENLPMCDSKCHEGKADCILSSVALYNHRMGLNGSSTCARISGDHDPPAGFVIDSNTAQKYIRCAYIFGAGPENRLYRGCGDAAKSTSCDQGCAFADICPSTGRKCVSDDVEVRNNADCTYMKRPFPNTTTESPCYYTGAAFTKGSENRIKEMVHTRLKHQNSIPGDNTDPSDLCPKCQNRLAAQTEIVMDWHRIRDDFQNKRPGVIRAFVYKATHRRLAIDLRAAFAKKYGQQMEDIPLVFMDTSVDVVSEDPFKVQEPNAATTLTV